MPILDSEGRIFAGTSKTDSALSPTSKNPVENKVVTNEFNKKQNNLTPTDGIYITDDDKIGNDNTIARVNQIPTKVSQLTNNKDYRTGNEVQTSIEAYHDDTKADLSKLDENVRIVTNANDITYSGDTVTYHKRYKNLKTGGTGDVTESIALANSSTAGLMSPSDVNSISQLVEDVSILKGQNVRLLYTGSQNPDAEDIEEFVSDLGYEEEKWSFIAVVVDGTNHIWRYFENTNVWDDIGIDTVNLFNNNVPGIIKGSATDGKVYAENDGTGSVYGWSELKGRVSDVETNKQDTIGDLSSIRSGASLGQTALQSSDVINNVISAITNKPLSANQGKVLKDLIDDLTNDKADKSNTDTKSEVNQKIHNAISGIESVNVIADEDNGKNYDWQIKVINGKVHLILNEVLV